MRENPIGESAEARGDVSGDITQVLKSVEQGDRSAVERLTALLYKDLRSIAARFLGRERSGHSLQPTDLVNEAFLKLVKQTEVSWQGKTHFFAIAAQDMRRILVDHARTKHRVKRGGYRRRLELRDEYTLSVERPDEILAIDETIEKLAALDPTHARILECRLFGGMGTDEIAAALGVSSRTVERYRALVRTWLRKELAEGPPER